MPRDLAACQHRLLREQREWIAVGLQLHDRNADEDHREEHAEGETLIPRRVRIGGIGARRAEHVLEPHERRLPTDRGVQGDVLLRGLALVEVAETNLVANLARRQSVR